MKCRDCPAFWHTEDDGGCYIGKDSDKKNGEPKEGCRLGIKSINKMIEKFEEEEEEFWTDFIKYAEENKIDFK